MCGIVGFTGHSLGEGELQGALASLHHRGPDGAGTFIDGNARVGLGQARLAIIDLQTGAQPLYSEDRDLVLVCNGEIYEHERLRVELEAQGHAFRSRSDSEVILHLYQEHGAGFVHHLRGEFAFLLYDTHKHTLLAVRDRFGIKPLFFNKQDGNYLFASEAKAMFATGRLKPRIDVSALRDYLSGVIPDAIFEDVKVVPPGCLLEVNLEHGTHAIERYWDVDLPKDDTPASQDIDRHVQTVRRDVEEAVRLRLAADVPVGVYLSGGMDSAVVAATAAKYHTGPIKAFNIAFPEDEAFNEFEQARNMAAKIGAEFHSVRCDQETLLSNMEDCLWVTELPFVNFHGVGKFLLSRLARAHVKVVLTGEGSDEVFLGYVLFQPGKGALSDQIANRLKEGAVPKGRHVRRIIKSLGFLPMQELANSLSQAQQKIRTWFFAREHRPRLQSSHPLDRLKERMDRRQTDGLPLARQKQYFWIKSLLAPYLLTMLGDRPEMGHSIEGRTPFLDHHLFEDARRIPDGLKVHNGVEKYVLREAFKEQVTDEVYQGKKWPYSAPPLWVRKGHSAELDRLMGRYLSSEALEKSGLFNRRLVRIVQWVSELLFFDCVLKRLLNTLLVFLLTVQILERLYVQEFDLNLRERMTGSPGNSLVQPKCAGGE